MLTGKPAYLSLLGNTENDVARQIQILRQLTADNSAQKKYIDSIDEMVSKSLQLSERIITQRKKYGANAAALASSFGQNDDLESARALIRRIQANENTLLANRESANKKAAEEVFIQLVWFALIAAALFFLFLAALRRYLNGRKLQLQKDSYSSALIANVQDAIMSTDKDLSIRSWNKGAEMIYGWKAEEVIGKSGPQLLQTKFQSETAETVVNLFKKSGYFRERWNSLQNGAKESLCR